MRTLNARGAVTASLSKTELSLIYICAPFIKEHCGEVHLDPKPTLVPWVSMWNELLCTLLVASLKVAYVITSVALLGIDEV